MEEYSIEEDYVYMGLTGRPATFVYLGFNFNSPRLVSTAVLSSFNSRASFKKPCHLFITPTSKVSHIQNIKVVVQGNVYSEEDREHHSAQSSMAGRMRIEDATPPIMT